MRQAVSCLTFALVATGFCDLAYSQCNAAPEIKASIDAYTAAGDGTAPEAERRAAQKNVLDKALAEHPTDPFLLDRQRDWFEDNTSSGREAAIAYFTELHEKYPDTPAITAMYAHVLGMKDSAQAVKLLEASEQAHPKDAWTHYQLLDRYTNSKSRNPQRLSEEIDAYLRLCPATNSGRVYRIIESSGTHEQIVRYAGQLRTRLEAETAEPNQALWTALWNLEFKAAPLAQHPAVRERIRKDLARFESLPDPNKATWLSFLLAGYKLLGDQAAIDRTEGRIVDRFPNSPEAERILSQNWDSKHRFPRDGDHATQQAWYRLRASAEHDWYERFHNTMQLWQEFDARASLDATTPEQLLAIARRYVAAYHENPNLFYGANPMEFDVADELIKRKALPDEIPAWLDEGIQRENNRPSRGLGTLRDDIPDDFKAIADQQIVLIRIERARILLDYYDAVGQPAKAAGIEDQLSGVNPTKDRLKPKLYEVHAHAALMQSRKLDALLYYRAARDLGGEQSYGGKTDAAELDKKIDALYKELGGTDATLSLFNKKNGLSPISSISWEAPKNPLPSFSLIDLGGKTWSLADLKGVATLVNVWATWCGPCREEHPELEKLYQKVKDRKDIAVLSVNVDEQAGLVAPYMAEHKYTFPVVLGKELVDSVMGQDGSGIPQNWIVSPTGKLETIQFGYGGDPNWQTVILSKLQGMAPK